MLTRREMLQLGTAAGGGAWLASRGGVRPAHSSSGGTRQRLRPFVSELPVPPLATPVNSLSPAPDPARHQLGFSRGHPALYEIRMQAAVHRFHPDLPPSRIWGYDGRCPGPTFHARYGQPVLVRFYNDLPTDHIGFGMPETTIHLHNHHTAAESDGNPVKFFFPGEFHDNLYQNFPAGDDPREVQSTLWYHDHRMDFTSQNLYRGFAGFYLMYDELDAGDETRLGTLRLPSGPYDVPLLIQDKTFDEDGELFLDPFNLDGFLGEHFVVNGQVQPFMRVARRKYRFRLLNGGPTRFYQLFLTPDMQSYHPLQLIATDGGLLPRPVEVPSIPIAVAERYEVIVDFSRYRRGDRIYLVNRLEQKDGRGPTGKLLAPGVPLLRFDVERDAPDSPPVPNQLRPLPDIGPVARTRAWRFERQNGAWAVNSRFFDPDRIDATPRQGTGEIWLLRNNGNWHHPIHIHLEEFQILSRNGQPPPLHERGKKDVAWLHPNEEVVVFLRFRDFLGRYPMHCHNTVHEDHAMMVQWEVVP